jgi:hypothetical protein
LSPGGAAQLTEHSTGYIIGLGAIPPGPASPCRMSNKRSKNRFAPAHACSRRAALIVQRRRADRRIIVGQVRRPHGVVLVARLREERSRQSSRAVASLWAGLDPSNVFRLPMVGVLLGSSGRCAWTRCRRVTRAGRVEANCSLMLSGGAHRSIPNVAGLLLSLRPCPR